MHNWPKETEEFSLVAREGDRVLIEVPKNSFAAKFNGQEGTITRSLTAIGWIDV